MMKALASIGLACLLVAAAHAEPNAPALVPDGDGYLPLFNGRDLTGWQIWKNKADFQIKDGVVRCQRGGDGQFMLYMGREFADFELVVEWRVSPKGNSGVFIRSPFREWPWDTGYEVQISNEQPPRDDMHCSGSLYGYAGVQPRPRSPQCWSLGKGTQLNEFSGDTPAQSAQGLWHPLWHTGLPMGHVDGV